MYDFVDTSMYSFPEITRKYNVFTIHRQLQSNLGRRPVVKSNH